MTMPGPALRSNNQDSTPVPAGPGWAFLFAAWLIATASTLGALFLSEVMQIAPCVLCWYQRVFMFPLVWVLATGLYRLRFATHLDVDAAGVDTAVAAIRGFFQR